MSQSKVFVAIKLYVSFLIFHHHFTYGDDSLYKTVFLVGPDPQPVAVDDKNGPLGSVNSGVISVALPSIPPEDPSGRRNLKWTEPLDNLPIVQSTDTSTSFSVGRSKKQEPNDTERSRRSMHNVTHSGAVGVQRALQGVCSITYTTLGFNFDDNAVENDGFYSIPPDPHGAVGANRLIAVVNRMIEVRRKDGGLTYRSSFESFFSDFTQAFSARFFDPKVIYDEHQNRFVVVVLQQSDSPEVSRIWLAASKDDTPDSIADWNQFFINSAIVIDGNNAWADYPGLEVDEEAVYVTNNMFKFSDRTNVGVRLWVFSKGISDGFYAGLGFSFRVISPYATQGVSATTMPAQVHGSSGVDASVGTFLPAVLVYTSGSVDLQIYTLFNPISASPTFTIQTIDLGVLTQDFLNPVAPQLGSSVGISTNDGRTLDAVWRNNKLWVVFTVTPTSGVNQGQATAHWVRCSTSGGTVTFEAQGNLGGEDIAPGTFTFFPSVAVNQAGLVAYGYAASSPTTYAGAYVSVGTSEQSYTVKSGLFPYVRTFGGPRNRWGDYTGISVDPTDDSFWVFNEYAETGGSVLPGSADSGRWGTVWGRLECDVRVLFYSVQRVLLSKGIDSLTCHSSLFRKYRCLPRRQCQHPFLPGRQCQTLFLPRRRAACSI